MEMLIAILNCQLGLMMFVLARIARALENLQEED